ncbi:MAG: helix-turn-helix transcriptional regulator [Bacteroidetes bacterium]|nr:helix-turn-helix transcriptional regulator [Bacteroidota bacterium]
MKSTPNKKFLKALGKRVKELREKQEISQSQLAFESDIPREQLSRIEIGKHATSVSNILSIANALSIHLKELYDFDY